MGIINKFRKQALWQQVFVGMVLGVLVGILLGENALFLKPIGDLFLNAIKMLIVPLIFFSLITGITSSTCAKQMQRIGVKSILVYTTTSIFAIVIGLLLGYLTQIGAGIGLERTIDFTGEVAESPSFITTLVNIIPDNPVNALSTGNILQIIFFALLCGIAMNKLDKEKVKPVADIVSAVAQIMYQLTGMVMKFSPIGVFALMAWTIGEQGVATLLPLIKLIVVIYIGYFIHCFFVLGMIVKLFAKMPILQFFRKILDAILVSYSTSSSAGTLPVSTRCADENLKVRKSISSFVLPLGATINMDGTALYQGVCVLFIAHAFGIDLTTSDYILIVLVSTLAAIGTAGIPGAGVIMLTLILSMLGLPLEGIALVAAIDRILDMGRTSVNVIGDLMATLVIDRTEPKLQETSELIALDRKEQLSGQ